jgi:hypothetical protein
MRLRFRLVASVSGVARQTPAADDQEVPDQRAGRGSLPSANAAVRACTVTALVVAQGISLVDVGRTAPVDKQNSEAPQVLFVRSDSRRHVRGDASIDWLSESPLVLPLPGPDRGKAT